MAGFENDVMYSIGDRLEPSTAQAIAVMQNGSSDVSRVNTIGSPEGVVAANPSSLDHDPSTGQVYIKRSGVGTTGWLPISTNSQDLHTAKFIVNVAGTVGTGANYSTIAAALLDAVSGETIFVMEGTYTENLTLKAGVAIQAFEAGALVGNIVINGASTFSQTGTTSIVGIKFVNTGSTSALITVSGANACTLNLQDCVFSPTLGTAVSITNSNASTVAKLYDCEGDIASAGAVIISSALGASIELYNCFFTNSSASTAYNSILTSGSCKIYNCQFKNGFLNSGTATIDIQDSIIDYSANNMEALNIDGSGTSTSFRNTFISGTASGVTIGGTATLLMDFDVINSTNANAITGVGTVKYGTIDFTGSSSTINTTTQTALVTQVGSLKIKTPISLSSPVPMMRDSTTGQVGVGATSVITTYLVSGSYSVNSNAKEVEFYVWGGGAGGGSGRDGASASAGGGGGGAGGQFVYVKTLASRLTASPYTVTIGAGGAGGMSVTATNTDGNPGIAGNPTSVVGVVIANGGGAGPAGVSGNAGGGTGSSSFILVGTSNSIAPSGGTGNATTGAAASNLTYAPATGGGGAAGYTAATPRAGRAGGSILDNAGSTLVAGGLAGSSAGATAGDGNAPTGQPLMLGGTGGGSGGHDGTITAGTGGNGAQPGGGGGGGAGNLSLNASGAGGNGGNGQVVIIEYF